MRKALGNKGAKRKVFGIIILMLLLLLFCSCEESTPPDNPKPSGGGESTEPIVLLPEAPGIAKEENDKAVIDYSNIKDGYVMVKFKAVTEKTLRCQMKCSIDTYTFVLTTQKWVVIPLGNGNDSYKIVVFENVEGNKYSAVLSASFTAELTDQFAPFIRPNQYVDYAEAKDTLKKAAELTAGDEDALSKVASVYDFVINNFKYDKELAENVQTGYLPVLDEVLKKKKGICFDYAAIMTAMLRSQGVPCKLVVGYAGESYHAWISVWSDTEGWIEKAVFFDGKSWQRMDPTFASTGKNRLDINKYIGDGSNYTEKYFY